jgi:hypothetical protein
MECLLKLGFLIAPPAAEDVPRVISIEDIVRDLIDEELNNR